MSDTGIWFLPGIRELEQILATQFTVYREFQDCFYWSSACAKESSWGSDKEVKTHARASKAYVYTVPADADNYAGQTFFRFYESSKDNAFTDHAGTGGYTPRAGTLLRIRAAYMKSDGSRITE